MPDGKYDRVEQLLIHYPQLSNRQKRRIEDNFLCHLPAREQYFARRRYVDGEGDAELIAEEMGYTARHVRRFREKLLPKFYLFVCNPENKSLRTRLRQILGLRLRARPSSHPMGQDL